MEAHKNTSCHRNFGLVKRLVPGDLNLVPLDYEDLGVHVE